MENLLPDVTSSQQYWATIYHRSVTDWQPALDVIRARHGLTGDEWERFPLGRNIVLALGQSVVKLSPPFWADQITRELDALQFVQRHLPIATPEPIASGSLEGWCYLIERRVPGTLLKALWGTLDVPTLKTIALQHGEVMAAVHAMPVRDAPHSLAFDWDEMLTTQRDECLPLMRAGGVNARLLQGVHQYLEQTWPVLDDGTDPVLVHGDLDTVNLIVAPVSGDWRIGGLVDWGDVKIGPRAHEFISPRMHMYRATPELLQAWFMGYGFIEGRPDPVLAQSAMARSMLYYADDFGEILKSLSQ